MNSKELRNSYLEFFREKQHTIVPSSSLLPTAPNLLFTNAGMNQFIPYFLGTETPPYRPARAADTQKCIRAGGKHNDLDDVGYDTYHHTFFEMLGNWSFGNYFKKEAIEWAWELLVDRWGFPPTRMYATVYRPGVNDPASFDQESYDLWAEKFEGAGLDPSIHIVNGNKKDNFWMMGDTGPCGPCSEVHIDLTRDGGTAGQLVNKGDARCIEIWNLVFIQFNAEENGTFRPLPAKHVDTGMGFERVASIMQCTKGFKDFSKLASNYDTDVFRPIFQRLEELSGHQYQATLPHPDRTGAMKSEEKADVAFRVLGDHVRTLSFSIADGILPDKNERNYVLRRILRRALRYSRDLDLVGAKIPAGGLMADLAKVVIAEFGDFFPELKQRQNVILETLTLEEEQFAKTLDRGIQLFHAELEKVRARAGRSFPAEAAFMLYDTYGFPVDLTEVLCREAHLSLDSEAVERLIEAQRERSRGAQHNVVVLAEDGDLDLPDTKFTGFEKDEVRTNALAVIHRGEDAFLVTEETPFYAKMGGQLGDSGQVRVDGETTPVPITDTIKIKGVFLHKLGAPLPEGLKTPFPVTLNVAAERRRNIEANHTATHLLHWALHQHVGEDVSQKGSEVAEGRLRFDFNSRPLTPEQIEKIEESVNRAIVKNEPVSWREFPYAQVAGHPEIKQLFGEKYGDTVRVVQIGGEPGSLTGYSMELCGGTHARATGELGAFKILSEGAVAAGTRRIEAVSGLAGIEYLRKALAEERAEVTALKSKLLETEKVLQKERAAVAAKEASAKLKELAAGMKPVNDLPTLRHDFGEADPSLLQALTDSAKSLGLEGACIFSLSQGGKTHYAVYVSKAYQKTNPANGILKAILDEKGGKGGGSPEMARGAA